jgi:hypothetical protein
MRTVILCQTILWQIILTCGLQFELGGGVATHLAWGGGAPLAHIVTSVGRLVRCLMSSKPHLGHGGHPAKG